MDDYYKYEEIIKKNYKRVVYWSVAFLLIAPLYAILKGKEENEAKMTSHNAI